MSSEIADIYFSCTGKDKDQIRQTKVHVEKAGYTTWWDLDKGQSSANSELLLHEAAQAIDACHVFVCCLSKDYLNSALAAKEVKLAGYWGKCIIPVKVGPLPLNAAGQEEWPPNHEIAPHLRKLFCVDLTDPKNYSVRIRELLSRLEKDLRPGPTGERGVTAEKAMAVEDMQPDDVCQLLAKLFIPQDKIERFIANGVSGKDLLDFSDEDLKGEDLQLTAIQVKKLRKELHKLLNPTQRSAPLPPVAALPASMSAQDAGASSASQGAVENSLAILARNKEKGDPEQIVAALRACVQDARVQVEGMQVIRNLVWGKAEEQNAVAAAGGIEAVIAGMLSHRDNMDVQEMGCSALGNLAWSNSAIQLRVSELGGIEEIVRATQAHVKSGGCMQKCTLALGNLACHSANQVKIAQQNGIQLVLNALAEHPGHPLCIQYCCWALKNLSLNEANKKRIAGGRGPRLIVEALRNYPVHAGIVEEACGCIRKLVWGNAENQNRVAQEGGIEAIITGMTAHVHKASVQQQCGLALGDLAWSNETNQARIGRAGGIPPIIAGIHAHPTHSGTQGGLALGNLASLCVANRKIVASAGGIPAILKSMKTNLQYPGVQEYGCWALRHLALDAECKVIILREGGAGIIRQGMQEYPNRAGVQDQGNAALKNLLS